MFNFKYIRELFLPHYTATNLSWYNFYRHYTKNQFVVKVYLVKPQDF